MQNAESRRIKTRHFPSILHSSFCILHCRTHHRVGCRPPFSARGAPPLVLARASLFPVLRAVTSCDAFWRLVFFRLPSSRLRSLLPAMSFLLAFANGTTT